MIPAMIGMGLGIAGGVANMIAAGAANRRLDQLYRMNPSYQVNPLAQQRLGLAQSLLNGRMAGAENMERNIYGNQANAYANIQKNATDSSQALALAGNVQGQTNAAFDNLAMQEANNYYSRLQNLNGAQQGMIDEGDKVFNDKVRRYNDLAAVQGAKTQNISNAFSSLSNMGFGAAAFGMGGGFGGGMSLPSVPYTRQWNTGYSTPTTFNIPTPGTIGVPH